MPSIPSDSTALAAPITAPLSTRDDFAPASKTLLARNIPLRQKNSQRPKKWIAQPAFILHRIDYRDSSQIAYAFTRDQGVISILAKGIKRHYSQLRHSLFLFQALQLSYTDRHELKLLTGAEWQGGIPPLPPARFSAGFYINELIWRLSPPEQAQPLLFALYQQTLIALATMPDDERQIGLHTNALLRQFEFNLLGALGWIDTTLRCSTDDEIVQAASHYQLTMQDGLIRVPAGNHSTSGASLLRLQAGEFPLPVDAAALQENLRQLIDELLNGKPLQTRHTWHSFRPR